MNAKEAAEILKQRGGTIYPTTLTDRTPGVGDAVQVFPGMTLRDYFAAQALMAIVRDTAEDVTTYRISAAAKEAYAYADAMLAESAK